MPNVSFCEDGRDLHHNPYVPPFFCKLTLNNGSVADIEGSGELTSAMTASYKAACVSAEIGDLCTSIGEHAFNECTSLSSVTIGNGVTSIGDGAFRKCSGLTSIEIPNSVTSIGGGAFQGCSGLSSITIPNSVTSIGNYAFEVCSGLTSITIGSGVTSIGSVAFQGCSGLTSITSYIMTAPSVVGGTFNVGSYNGTLYVPIGSSGYDTWMNNQGNLVFFNWTKVEQ